MFGAFEEGRGKKASGGAVYLELLTQQVLPVLGDPQRNWLFQDNSDLPHRAHIVTDLELADGIRTTNWSAKSPDMNPIEEHAWDEIKHRIYRAARVAPTLQQLEACVRQRGGESASRVSRSSCWIHES